LFPPHSFVTQNNVTGYETERVSRGGSIDKAGAVRERCHRRAEEI
jgi:hypothetical protein